MFPILAGSNPSGYNLTRSLRTRASASAYLSRTPATTSGNQIFTTSFWIKRAKLSVGTLFIYAYQDGSNANGIGFNANDTFQIACYDGGAYSILLITTQVFRDPSAWYHIVVSVDTTQATASNRAKIYVNGSQVTALSTATYPTQNASVTFNKNVFHTIGASYYGVLADYYDGYLAEFNWITGQALTPSSFGSTNTLTGVWQPAAYTGTYGTNGFYLPFTDNSALTTSSNVGLGKDFSGNGNYWTTNNISITSGVTYDSMTDVPTLTSATAANFAVLNPLQKASDVTVSNGNLTEAQGATYRTTPTTMFVSSGKWYAEMTGAGEAGIVREGAFDITTRFGYGANQSGGYAYNYFDGNKANNGVASAYGATYTTGDVIGVAMDLDAGTLTFYKNNVSQGVAFSSLPAGNYGFGTGHATSTVNWNFGQQPFAYTPPTGFVALNTYNLPTSTILKGNTVMDATLYTGNGSTQTITNAAGFKPDFVWGKMRASNGGLGEYHQLYDSIRGINKALFTNDTSAEVTITSGGVTAFNSNGFEVAVGSNNGININAKTYVGWQWQAGQGTNTTNTSGTITSTVSVNASAGFSVVTYTGNGSTGTVGHGLGVTPQFIIVKSRGVDDWYVYHVTLGASTRIQLNLTTGSTGGSAVWNSTSPTSSVFSVGNAATNGSSTNYVAYCWTPIAGYSAFGSYTGNGSTDGPFVYTGFRPKYVMVKSTSNGENWIVLDTARDSYNLATKTLYPNSSSAEETLYNYADILSNGFKFRTTNSGTNGSGYSFIYIAFAENPFKNALAR